MLHEVIELPTYILVLIIPTSVASAERSFRSLRHLKTYLCSTMTQNRLLHILFFHIYGKLTGLFSLQDIIR